MTHSIGRTLSVIVPALNEEESLESAVATILESIGDRFSDYELLLFDDGSTDRTGEIVDALAAGNPHIRAFHNGQNMGIGYSYTRGAELARMEYVAMFPGDNEHPGAAIRTTLDRVGSADIVVPFPSTPAVRSWGRRLVSFSFVILLNLLFGLRLRYFNGPCVHRRALLLSIPMKTHGFAYMAAILIRLIRSGHSYIEVAVPLQPRLHGRSKAFRLRNILSVFATVGGLLWDVRIRERRKYAVPSQRVESRA